MYRSLKHFAKKYHISISLVSFSLFGTILFLFSYYMYQTQNIANIIETTKSDQIAYKETINKIKVERAAQRAAAIDVATRSKTATADTSSTLDSTACNLSKTHNDPSHIDVVVNKQHCLQPLSYVPTDIVTINDATISMKAASQFDKLYKAAIAAGNPVQVTSSYRSYTDQISSYSYWLSTVGSENADTYSARPGYSEHQTGFAVDFTAGLCSLYCFVGSTQYSWLQANAADYGFIQRYMSGTEKITGYQAEEWHYRFVGVQVAKDMKNRGITTLEEYWGLKGGNY